MVAYAVGFYFLVDSFKWRIARNRAKIYLKVVLGERDKRFMSKLVKVSQNIKLERERETNHACNTTEVIPSFCLIRLTSLLRCFTIHHPQSPWQCFEVLHFPLLYEEIKVQKHKWLHSLSKYLLSTYYRLL